MTNRGAVATVPSVEYDSTTMEKSNSENAVYSRETVDRGYAWLIMILSTFMHLMIYSILYSFSVFYIEFSEFFQKSKAEIGILLSLIYFFQFGVGIISGPFISRFGCRSVGIVGVVVSTTGLLSSAFTQSIYQLYFTYGTMTGIGLGIQIMPTIVIVKDWFDKRRPLALSVCTTGAPAAVFAGPPLTQYLISQFGWRGAFIILAGISLQGLWLTALYRAPPSNPQRAASIKDSGCKVVAKGLVDFSLLCNPIFIVTLIGMTCLSIAVNMVYQHTPSRAYYIGLTREEAASVPMSLSMGSLIMRVPMGFVFLKKGVNRTVLLAGFMLIAGVVIASAALVRSWWSYLVYGFIMGGSIGTSFALRSTVLVDLFTPQGFVRSQGLVFASFSIAGLALIPLSGWIYDVTSNYDDPFFAFGGIMSLGGALIFLAYLMDRKKRNSSSE